MIEKNDVFIILLGFTILFIIFGSVLVEIGELSRVRYLIESLIWIHAYYGINMILKKVSARRLSHEKSKIK